MHTFGPGIGVSAYVERLYDPPPEFGYKPVDGGIGRGRWGHWAGRFLGDDGYRGLRNRQLFG
jgi:hypothetical protein